MQNGFANKNFLKENISKCKEVFYAFKYDIHYNSEIVYLDHPALRDFKGKTILIIGGGNSANKLDFDKLLMDQLFERSSYDSIWSLNSFFLHPYISKLKLDLVTLGPDNIPHKRQEQLDYLNKFKPLVGYELHQKWTNLPGKEKIIKYINESYDLDRSFFFNSRFYTLIGAGARLKLFAAVLGVAQVDFIGFDGYQAILKGKHAFEPGKNKPPSRCALYKDPAAQWMYEYELFWHYVQDKWPSTRFVSLDKENPYHKLVR